jgi:hypothetical protein
MSTRSPRLKLVIGLSLAGLLGACSPPAISNGELNGKWVVCDRKGQAHEPKGGSSLDLRPDGSFSAIHIPVDLEHTAQPDGDLTGSGRWKVDHEEGRQIVSLDVKAGTSAAYPGGYWLPLEIAGGPGDRTIFLFRGDPDAGDTLDLRRACR